MTVVSVAAGHAREAVVEHQRTDASLDELTLFLARLTGLLLRSSGEGAELIEDSVRSAARSLARRGGFPAAGAGRGGAHRHRRGRDADRDGARVPEVFRLDQVTALKPLLTDVRDGRLGVLEAG